MKYLLQLMLAFWICLFAFEVQLSAQDETATANPEVAAQDDAEEAKSSDKPDEEKKPEKPKTYSFTVETNLDCTDVKSQDKTGTCWSYATASLIESELLRQNKGKHQLSEMFIAKNIYKDKARNYILRHGSANFSEGALAHDFLNAAGKYGLVPDEAYDGLIGGAEKHDHSEMVVVLDSMLKALAKQRRPSPLWDDAFAAVLDTYMGATDAEFTYNGEKFTPKSFAEYLEFNPDDYVSFTSFTHHPFGRPFVLEIPDNFSNGSFQNVPIDRLVEIMDHALENGYTLGWDGDVSETTFSSRKGIAVLPAKSRSNALTVPGDEKEVTQQMRQDTFENFTTTDDHLMHLVGSARDQNGTKYYIIKNSWGPDAGPYGGFLYMSEAYVRLKTVAIVLHKDGVPSDETKAKKTSK